MSILPQHKGALMQALDGTDLSRRSGTLPHQQRRFHQFDDSITSFGHSFSDERNGFGS
jgi:hypothetical protein